MIRARTLIKNKKGLNRIRKMTRNRLKGSVTTKKKDNSKLIRKNLKEMRKTISLFLKTNYKINSNNRKSS
jgi:hypothetical protein